jgi:superoxide reductase
MPADERIQAGKGHEFKGRPMNHMKIYRCSQCGKIAILTGNEPAPECCSLKMTVLEQNPDFSLEDTHMPVIHRKDGHLYAYAGAYSHPMEAEHYIEWIVLESEASARICYLKPGDEPKAEILPGEGVIAVYAYCSRHGLWSIHI